MLQTIHRFLFRRSAYPLLISSSLALALFIGRVYLSRTTIFIFLVWNLFLAWIPYLSSMWADVLHSRNPRKWWRLLVPGLLWLAFFPNAPYIVTDLWHLSERPYVPYWYDIGLLTTFVLSGIFLAIISLRNMQRLVAYYAGSFVSWLFVFGGMALGGLGVYIGRFLRWNSWDLLFHPQKVFNDIFVQLSEPLTHPRTFGVTILVGAILLTSYLCLVSNDLTSRCDNS
ncbi:MAG: DUF1361 domain-containing protein [Anaerolineales bacterium]|nr:DUF1361 domain-containing protein [Anaerolineales bacterium]